MIGGNSPDGYRQRGLGNSKGKASLESHNRLGHTMLSFVPGQTGPLYDVRPMDLAARAKEASEIWETARHLPDHLRSQVGYPILTINQARRHLFNVFTLQNERTEHDLQGFEDIVEFFDPSCSRWVPSCSRGRESALIQDPALRLRKRRESPLERCSRLISPYRDQWTQISPDIITAFYEHTVRQCRVQDNGLIEFRTDDRAVEFMPAPDAVPQVPGTKLLGYFHPDDPAFLHLTTGNGSVVGTWLRRARAHDEATLQTAIRYSQSALSAAKAIAGDYAADERARLDQMRSRNAELLAANTFIEVASPETMGSRTSVGSRTSTSPIASALSAISAERDVADRKARAAARAAAEDILASSDQGGGRTAAADDLLSAISKP